MFTKMNGGGSGEVVKYKTAQTGNKTFNITSDFPNYSSLTANNFLVVTTGDARNVKYESSAAQRNFGGIFHAPIIAYDNSTGILTITGPNLYAGGDDEGWTYANPAPQYDVYVAENIS